MWHLKYDMYLSDYTLCYYRVVQKVSPIANDFNK